GAAERLRRRGRRAHRAVTVVLRALRDRHLVLGTHLPREAHAVVLVPDVVEDLTAVRRVEREAAVGRADVLPLVGVVEGAGDVVLGVPVADRGVIPEVIALDGPAEAAADVVDLLDLRRLRGEA